MKTFVYIGIIGASALLLASCKGKSKPMETPVPSISVSTPIVRDITLTKEYPGYLSSQGEFYQFNLSSCITQQNSLTAQFVSFSLANLANIFYPPPRFLQ